MAVVVRMCVFATMLATVAVTIQTAAAAPAPRRIAVSVAAPAPGATVSGTVTVTGTGGSRFAVRAVKVSVDGGPAVTAAGTWRWRSSWNTTTVPDGRHVVTATAIGATGVTRSATVTVTVANSPGIATTARPPSGSSVALPPVAPQPYDVPSTGVSVSTGTALRSALQSETPTDIILEDGTFSTTGYFAAATGHRLWARHGGKAVLTSGLMLGGNYGSGNAEVHGLVVDITSTANAPHGAAIDVWGSVGVGTKVYDTVLNGHYVATAGIRMSTVDDAVVQRVVARQFSDFGVYVSDCCDANWYDNPSLASTITDVDVDGVHRAAPGSADGTAEFGLWVGNGVERPVERIRVEHAWWGGIWTGSSSHDTVFRDLIVGTVDKPDGTGIYNEHNTVRNTFERFSLGPDVAEGFVCEWNYGSGVGACDGNVFQDGVIASRKAGVFLDEGQRGNVVRRVAFVGQSCAAIVDNKGSGNTFADNDYSGVVATAKAVASYC